MWKYEISNTWSMTNSVTKSEKLKKPDCIPVKADKTRELTSFWQQERSIFL